MPDFRIKYGKAVGPLNNFYARTDGTFSDTDTTPDVTNGCLFYTLATNTATITNFDLAATAGAGNAAGLFEGKEIRLVFGGSGTTLAPSARLLLTNTDSLFDTGDVINFMYHTSAWYETSRANDQSQYSNITDVLEGGSDGITVTRYTKNVGLSGVSAANVLKSISGGATFQSVNLYKTGSNPISVSTSGNIYTGSDVMAINESTGILTLVKHPGGKWCASHGFGIAP